MGIVVAAILILAGTVAWAAAGYLVEAFPGGGGVPALILGLLGLLRLSIGFKALAHSARQPPG